MLMRQADRKPPPLHPFAIIADPKPAIGVAAGKQLSRARLAEQRPDMQPFQAAGAFHPRLAAQPAVQCDNTVDRPHQHPSNGAGTE